MRLSTLLLLFVIVMVSACGGDSSDDDNTTDNTVNGPSQSEQLAAITWPQVPEHIVFRADVVGGADFASFERLGEVPPCTIYGDGRVIWVVDTTQGGQQTLINVVSPDAIRSFAQDAGVGYNLYNQQAAGDIALDSTAPVVEQLYLNVNDRPHTTDSLGDWDLVYFDSLLTRCIETAGDPIIFEPTGGWLNVLATEYDSRSPLQRWDENITGVNLAEIAADGSPVWIEGRLLEIMWDLVERNTPDMQLDQNGQIFQIAVQVPNVTRNAPRAPSNSS